MSLSSLIEQERARRPSASDASCVRAVAANVIEELGLDAPPIDVQLVASYLGIHRVIEDPALVETGCLICDDDKVVVRVRQGDSPARKRFTICHESGHTFFPGYRRRPRFRCDPGLALPARGGDRGRQSDQELEQLCDLAASELLMPATFFFRDAQAAAFGLDDLEMLADIYGASLEATARRMVGRGGEPQALVVLRSMQAPAQRGTDAPAKLRVASAVTFGDWPFIPRYKSTGPETPFGRALLGEDVHEMAVVLAPFGSPIEVEVAARAYPYQAGGERIERVIALLRRPGIRP